MIFPGSLALCHNEFMPRLYFLPTRLLNTAPRLAQLVQKIEGLLFSSLFRLFKVLPVGAASRVAERIFKAWGPRAGKQRARALRNLRIAFPELSEAELDTRCREIFGFLGRSIAELAHAKQLWAHRSRYLEFVADPSIEAIGHKGIPAVIVTAHVGPWQLASYIASHYDLPMTIIYAPESNPRIRDQIHRYREDLPVTLLPRDSSMRSLVRELAAGHLIGIAADTRLDSGPPLPFFGVDTPSNTAAARLALGKSCELIPVRTERLSRSRFRVSLLAPVKPRIEGSNAEQAIDMTKQLLALFEGWIRETPSEWLCFARRWPKI